MLHVCFIKFILFTVLLKASLQLQKGVIFFIILPIAVADCCHDKEVENIRYMLPVVLDRTLQTV